MTNIVSDVSKLTTIPEKTLNKFNQIKQELTNIMNK